MPREATKHNIIGSVVGGKVFHFLCFFFILRKPKQHSRENRPTATHSVSYRTTAYSQARAYLQTHSASCQVRLLFFFIVFFFRFLLMVAKYLRVDALLEFSCHEMTLWDKLGGSIV